MGFLYGFVRDAPSLPATPCRSPSKPRTLCLENGRVNTCVDPAGNPRQGIRAVFTCAAYERQIGRLPGFANRNLTFVIDR
jgi:hypothetical protein